MMKLLIFLLVLFFQLASSDQFGFTLQYTGFCLYSSNLYQCYQKALSEAIATSIAALGNVTETVEVEFGSISQAVILLSIGETMNTFVGNATFGIHQTNTDHYIEYS